jgi:ABC-type glycerol-3-phosphate transport system substrate-binding protein
MRNGTLWVAVNPEYLADLFDKYGFGDGRYKGIAPTWAELQEIADAFKAFLQEKGIDAAVRTFDGPTATAHNPWRINADINVTPELLAEFHDWCEAYPYRNL